MRKHVNFVFLFVLLSALFLGACGSAPAAPVEQSSDTYAQAPSSVGIAPPVAGGGAGEASNADAAKSGIAPASVPVGPVYNTGSDTTVADSAHMIVKTGEIKLLVEDTDTAIERATQTIGDSGGYIVSSRVWYQAYVDGKNYKYATITIGVPVLQFERALNRFRGLAIQVLDENESGDDVTNQYVDLQSQLTNLEATQERIKSFLAEAQTVDEALRINAELANVESQIEQIKGQINYLQNRSAYSTITIDFEPKLPDITPTPTPEPAAWQPGKTFDNAKGTIIHAYQGIVDFLIWIFVVVVPLLAPPVFLLWLVWKLLTRKPKKSISSE